MLSGDDLNSSDFLDCKQFRQASRGQLQATESYQSTTNGFVATTKLVDTKARVVASVDGPFAAISTPLYAAQNRNQNQIVDMIRRDFCLPSEYDDDLGLVAANDFQNAPKFRFKQKALKTYSKERKLSADLNPITDNQDDSNDHLSYSSELSVEEAGEADEQKLLTKLDHLNSSSSQKLYENLQNLGEYLSTSYNKTDATINENKKTTNSYEVKNSEDVVEASTHFENTPTSGTQSKVCADWSDSDSILADYTTDPSDDLTEQQDNKNNSMKTSFIKPSDEIDLLSDIPLSEWQTPMELPALKINQQFEKAQCSTEAFGFSTASRKLIPISDTTKRKGSLLMASVTTAKSNTDEMNNNAVQPIRAQRGLSRIVENRKTTEPNHDILIKSDVIKSNTLKATIIDNGLKCKEATETKLPKPLSTLFEIKKPSKESKFINSDRKSELLKNIKTISDCDILQTKVVKEVNLTNLSSACSKVLNQHTLAGMNSPNSSDICKALIACQEIINVSADTKDKAIKVLAELQALQLENQTFLNDPSSIEPIQTRDEDDTVHTACKKLLGISDQATNNVKEILANLEATTSQRVLLCKPRFDEFNAACTKMINVMEESKNVALKILRNVKESHETQYSQNDINYYKSLNTNGKSVGKEKGKTVTTKRPNRSDCCVIEENVALAASENSFESEYNGLQTKTCQEAYEPINLSTLGTVKLQNQENTDEICLNDFNIASKSQPETKFERTSPCTPDIHPSLSQLVHRSPLDKSTKSAIIGRRNLLTLNRRKLVKRIHYEDKSKTDFKTGLIPMPTHTSTPLVDRNPNVIDNSTVVDLRSNSSHDELTPINKKRRRCLGLSRMPNKF